MEIDPAEIGNWVRRARQRDPEAGEALVTLLHPTVSSVVHRCCPWREDFRDLVQDVFLKIFQNLDQLQASGPGIYVWARRIALTTCLNRRRWWRSRPELRWADLSESQAELLAETAGSVASSDPGQLSEARDLVEKMLERLEPRDRLLIELLELEQCGLPEVQRLTGWSAVNVRVRAFRARRKLRTVLRGLLDK